MAYFVPAGVTVKTIVAVRNRGGAFS